MGITKNSTVGEVMEQHQKKKHRQPILNHIEEELRKLKLARSADSDVMLWKGKNDRYYQKFMTKETRSQIRVAKPSIEEYKGIWFPHSTPKYSFITWLATKNRLAT
ncbi:unnamed protein product [Arabidopsis halleri]